ncbi:MAG: glutamine--fructose-6-phosphate aminotransferase, partial [Oscillospiraceae bacterium]|nr:glutamine--fructose-6-phosphate aminotransferase [Oscillospiraceae bacterium]
MCGIIGYSGSDSALPYLLNGLERLEYRGYDSAGVAVVSDSGVLQVQKSKGRLAALKAHLDTIEPLCGSVGIGHTRWATHGEPNDVNAHPHTGEKGKIAVVHNGIIENYLEIKNFLIRKGVHFHSETDTEVIAQLLEYYYSRCNDIVDAVYAVLARIKGAYAMGILCSDYPEQMIAARKDAPLLIGYGDGCNYIASDVTALLAYTRTVSYMEDDEVAIITNDSVNVFDAGRLPLEKEKHLVEWDVASAEKGGYA